MNINSGVKITYDRDKYLNKFVLLVLENAPKHEEFNISDLNRILNLEKDELKIFRELSSSIMNYIVENKYAELKGDISLLLTDSGRNFHKNIMIENLEFEKLKTDLLLNKWLIKTKWMPHIIAILSILISIYFYTDSKVSESKMEKKIKIIESKIELLKNQQFASKKVNTKK